MSFSMRSDLASRIRASRRGSVSLMFAGMAIPLVLMTALAVDYSFYVEAQSAIDVAADAGALHAVRVASAEFVAGTSLSQAKSDGQAAGQQWFDAQLGTLTSATLSTVTIPQVGYDASTGTFSETVSYSGTVATHLGAAITQIPNWRIGGSSTATIGSNTYAGFYFVVDNSSSMLIGATQDDIVALENLTVCPPSAVAPVSRTLGEYSWNYPANIGYGAGQTVPTASTVKGSCYGNFTGGAAQCPYPQGLSAVNKNGFCAPGYGTPDSQKRIDSITKQIANVPSGPCAFACHQQANNDYYTLARSASPKITLRFDVIQASMANVMNTLIGKQTSTGIANQFTVGVYQFNDSVNQVHPTTSCNSDGTAGSQNAFCESDVDLSGAATHITQISTPIVPDVPNTNFPGAMTYLAGKLSPSGDGGSPTARKKNMFIITDGLEDFQPANQSRYLGPVTTVGTPTSPEAYCSKMKSLGYNIYVLYTPYYPLPNPFYLNSGPRGYVEPTVPPATSNPVVDALRGCATNVNQFYSASDKASIDAAMALMVASAIASPGGFSD